MSPAVIGSCGVGLLLAAFVLNLARKLSERHPLYLTMNAIGAFLAAWYAYAGQALPFVILESVWGTAALVRLIGVARENSRR
jgi:hypothetical protein